jgi:hypothetical protein
MDQIAHRSAAAHDASASRVLTAEPPRGQRAKRTNNALAGVNMNTARGRRVADLVRSYLKALGNPDDVGRQAEIITAAELQVLAEEGRAAALQSPKTGDLDCIVRIQGAADRALRRLGIKPGAAQKPPTLKEYLASKQRGPETTKGQT